MDCPGQIAPEQCQVSLFLRFPFRMISDWTGKVYSYRTSNGVEPLVLIDGRVPGGGDWYALTLIFCIPNNGLVLVWSSGVVWVIQYVSRTFAIVIATPAVL
jgi:hypothetical protein